MNLNSEQQSQWDAYQRILDELIRSIEVGTPLTARCFFCGTCIQMSAPPPRPPAGCGT